jgi:hypothetical protein
MKPSVTKASIFWISFTIGVRARDSAKAACKGWCRRTRRFFIKCCVIVSFVREVRGRLSFPFPFPLPLNLNLNLNLNLQRAETNLWSHRKIFVHAVLRAT